LQLRAIVSGLRIGHNRSAFVVVINCDNAYEGIIKTILLFLLGLAVTDAIAGDNWIFITSSDTKTYEARVGSLQPVFTESGEPAAILLIRVFEIATKKLSFVRHYVRIADCRAGFGKLGEADLSGHATYEAEFVFDGGNVASKIAETICMSAALQTQEIQMKIAPELEF